jgi:hypothetical protein
MPTELSAWLRQQRQDRGWPVPEMARRLRDAARDSGDKAVPGKEAMARNIRRWEAGQGANSGVSERYRMHYCQALGIPLARFGPCRPREAAGDPAGTPAPPDAPTAGVATLAPSITFSPAGPDRPQAAIVAYRWMQEPDSGGSWMEREVVMAAHEGGEHAEQAERRDIGEATLEQLRADVTRLSHAYMTREPLPLFLEMRRVRSRIYAALDRRLWPRDQVDLYFLLAALNGLMAHAANDLGYPRAAEELARAGWAYAVAIDHRPLMGYLRSEQANIAYYQDRPRQARDLARSGLDYLPGGAGAVRLHCSHGMAAARLGYAAEARAAIAAAHETREGGQRDDLHDGIGGQFAYSPAKQSFMAGTALGQSPGGEAGAAAELRTAIRLFGTGPAEDRSYGCEALTHINLTRTLLHIGDLDAADLEPVFSLPADKRIVHLPRMLSDVRSELARPHYRGAPRARDLDERIEEFCRETIADGLHGLAAGPG